MHPNSKRNTKVFLTILNIGKALGKGTFGKVKLATHTLTNEKVAIKILEKSRIKDKKDIERISREIKILKKVRHPNII
jgi:5'-AMP-activated protein kinase, catalytic alpha subunit